MCCCVQNVPAEGWWVPIVSNPFLLAVINMLVDAFVIQGGATWLAKLRLGIVQMADMDSESTIKFSRTRISLLLMLQLYQSIVAPLVSTFIVDEVRAQSLLFCLCPFARLKC